MLCFDYTQMAEPRLLVPGKKPIGPVAVRNGANSPDYYWPIRGAMEKEIVRGVASALAGTPPRNQNGMDCVSRYDCIDVPNTLIQSKGAILVHARVLNLNNSYHYYFSLDGSDFGIAYSTSNKYHRFYIGGAAVDGSADNLSVGDLFTLLALWDDIDNVRRIWVNGVKRMDKTTSYSIPAFTDPLLLGTRTATSTLYSGLRIFSVGLWKDRWPANEAELTKDPYQFVKAA